MGEYLYNFINILSFIFVFGLIVFVHEFGHFFMARRAGCRIDEFGFGFGPKLFGWKKGETKYAIKLFPIGGYVKIYGEEGGEDTNNPKSFASKTPLQKFSILIAGVTMNFILAIVILTGIFIVGFKPLIPQNYNLPGIIDNQKVLIPKRQALKEVGRSNPLMEKRPGIHWFLQGWLMRRWVSP